MTNEPQSALTRERPDLWRRALRLAMNLTGYEYPAKMPLADGTITACGFNYPMPTPETPEERERREIEKAIREIEWEIERFEKGYAQRFPNEQYTIGQREWLRRQLEKAKAKRPQADAKAVVVPEGAMEWLLHEVGHWVAATPEERALPNYGYNSLLRPDIVAEMKGKGSAREWQAWAFEEIVLGPFGHSRDFAAPSYRGGVAFAKNGPIPSEHLRHAERRTASIDIAEWRALYGDWVNYERQRNTPSWKRPN